ncbi:rubrivinodin family lasso peptide [Piscinibacter sakaiensis]|uniref:Uncharacterized protein n=1 Tax=Piscinibacter sakaiensis TaxID=1547922 RepID=A0A0K8P840_PISS1|nr:rubrivinodin family lasso peptide [Piscinibacter sakaiensis]GAP38659.1 hypothetical protein ISF6_5212 [Piscinibacter sakaiensis]
MDEMQVEVVDLGDAKEVTLGVELAFNEELIDALPRLYD